MRWCIPRRSALKEQTFPRPQCHSQWHVSNWWLRQLKAHFLPCTLELSPCSYLLMQPSPRQAPCRSWCRLEGSSLRTRQRGSPVKLTSVTLFQWRVLQLLSRDLICIQPGWLGKRRPQLPKLHNLVVPGCSWGSVSDLLSETQVGVFLQLVHIIPSSDF